MGPRRLHVVLFAVVLAAVTSATPALAAEEVALTAPAAGARVSGAVVVQAEARAGSAVEKVQFLADARSFATVRQAPYRATWNAAGATVGRHELKAYAVMRDGSVVTDRVEVVVGEPTAPLWTGDFSTGDFSQWGGEYGRTASLGGDRLRVVDAPGGGGGFAARFTVRPGDQPVAAGGDRSELIYQDRTVNGVLPGDGPRWYTWETYVPSDYASDPGYQTITQWHQAQIPAPSPLKVMLTQNDTMFELRGRTAPRGGPDQTLAAAPLARGEWHRWVVGVDWSNDPAEGWVEAYLDGRQILKRTARATQYTAADGTAIFNHFKQGLYRDKTIDVEQTLFLRATRVGLTRTSVDGAGPRAGAR